MRLGTVTAHDRKALARWRTVQARLGTTSSGPIRGTAGAGLAGAELEQVLLAMARTNGDIVAVVRAA